MWVLVLGPGLGLGLFTDVCGLATLECTPHLGMPCKTMHGHVHQHPFSGWTLFVYAALSQSLRHMSGTTTLGTAKCFHGPRLSIHKSNSLA